MMMRLSVFNSLQVSCGFRAAASTVLRKSPESFSVIGHVRGIFFHMGAMKDLMQRERSLFSPMERQVLKVLETVDEESFVDNKVAIEAKKVLNILRNQPFSRDADSLSSGAEEWVREQLFAKDLVVIPIIGKNYQQIIRRDLDPLIRDLGRSFALGDAIVHRIVLSLLQHQVRYEEGIDFGAFVKNPRKVSWGKFDQVGYHFQPREVVLRHFVHGIFLYITQVLFFQKQSVENIHKPDMFFSWGLVLALSLSEAIGGKYIKHEDLRLVLIDACFQQRAVRNRLGLPQVTIASLVQPLIADMVLQTPDKT